MKATKLLTRVFALVLLATGLSSPALAQEYKESFNSGLEAAKANNMTEAVSAFKKAAQGAQTEGDEDIARKANYYVAQLEYKQGLGSYSQENYEAALKHFESGIASFPTYAKNYLGKGLALKKMDRLDDAMATFKETITVGTDNRDRDTAQKAEEGIRSHYNYLASSALNRNGAKPSRTDAQEVLTHMEALQGYLEPDADTHYYVAEAYKVMGEYDQAITHANQALEMHRGSRTDKAKIYFTLGEAMMFDGNTAGAKDAFANATFGPYKASAEHYLETL